MNMPEPSACPAPADRSAEILVSLRAAFAEKGFDGASMQDLARAAGMSVGNFYRYFPSKDAIIAGMAAYDLAELQTDFTVIRQSADPLAMIRDNIRRRITDRCGQNGRLWAEITAAAQRKPEIAKISCGVEEVIGDNMVQLFAALTQSPPEAFRAAHGTTIRFIIMLVKSAAMRHVSHPDAEVEEMILQTIDDQIRSILSAPRA
ncbi:TetR/AcrR family transcriptional regulator [Xinfangfangia sp. CPCC 101601]|uniref:TetR/AcrR family transcriptional regulator n=1 Tax=Pseudogemmobacter lacusdianii TaxID=3069608 RepID=A0ABU0W0V3_9RHOB|nr:TetR/AcrR family transcriptional regulator [Xinfangfangia sp. CPCC 101601]MDQ2067644.1 TetR/AcrR family transcriptional regulator [Xinfangfangia sp. CPCC 101601]